jgi:hypothetical protein
VADKKLHVQLRDRTPVHTPMTFIAPFVALVAAVIAMAYFYVVNASITDDTLQSWSCRWTEVNMLTRPHWGTLCKESKAGLYLSILLIPIEAITFAIASYQAGVERNVNSLGQGRRSKASHRGSPSPS